MAIQTRWLQIFEHIVHLESDHPQFFHYFDRLFGRFQATPQPNPLNYKLIRSSADTWQFAMNDATWQLSDNVVSAELLAEKSVFNIFSYVQSHYLFHAGVIAHGDSATALVGKSHRGKSTLTVALVQNGARLLSDESLVIGLHDQQIHAFPRTVQLRPGSASLLNIPASEIIDGRFTVDLFDQEIAPARLRKLIFLEPHSAEKIPENTLYLHLSNCPPAWLAQIRSLPTVSAVESNGNKVKITTSDINACVARLESDSSAFNVCVLHVAQAPIQQPDFSNSAEITPISRAMAAHHLLANFQNGWNSTLFREQHKADSGHLFLSLIRLLTDVDSYILHVGSLDQMVAHVEAQQT